MGMFDKDKQYGRRVDRVFGIGESFILLAAELTGESVETNIGEAPVARLTVAKLAADGTSPASGPMDVQTIASAIVGKVREAEADDFPAVVALDRVESKNHQGVTALILDFVGEYRGAPVMVVDQETGEAAPWRPGR